MRNFAAKVITGLAAGAFWVWWLAMRLLDLLGLSTAKDDWNEIVDEKVPRWAEWLFSTPSWAPAALGALLTIVLIFAVWPRARLAPDAKGEYRTSPTTADETPSSAAPSAAVPLEIRFRTTPLAADEAFLDLLLEAKRRVNGVRVVARLDRRTAYLGRPDRWIEVFRRTIFEEAVLGAGESRTCRIYTRPSSEEGFGEFAGQRIELEYTLLPVDLRIEVSASSGEVDVSEVRFVRLFKREQRVTLFERRDPSRS